MDLIQYRQKLEKSIKDLSEITLPQRNLGLPEEQKLDDVVVVSDDGFFFDNKKKYPNEAEPFSLQELEEIFREIRDRNVNSESCWIRVYPEKYCRKSDVIDVLLLLKKLNIQYEQEFD